MAPSLTGSDGFITKAREKTFAEAPHNLRFLFLLSIAVHLVDFLLFNFNRTAFLQVSVVMYLALAAFAFFFFKSEEGWVKPLEIFKFVGLSAFYIAVPFFFYLIPNIDVIGGTSLPAWVSFFIAIIPLWPIYVGNKAKIPLVHHYVNFWIVFLLFFFIFLWGIRLNPTFFTSLGGRPELLVSGEVFNYLVENVGKIWKNIWTGLKDVPGKIENATGIAYYTAMIDGDNKKPPVGLSIEYITPDKNVFVGGDGVVTAIISGKSFTREIVFSPTCYADDKLAGVPTPKVIRIFNYASDMISCKFTNLSKGSYRIKIGGGFTFDTWAYVQYDFVDMDIYRSMTMEGKDINRELDIPAYPKAIRTQGPVDLGMSPNIRQPFQLDMLENTIDPPLGVTISNAWTTEGEIDRAELFMLLVPNEFELVDCDRGTPQKAVGESYSNYTFDVSALGDLRTTYQTITCRIHAKNPRELLMGKPKVQRTFVGMVRYKYKVERSSSFTVRE